MNEGKAATATIYTDVREEFWKHTDISWETDLEFQKILKSFQKTKSIETLLDYVEKLVSTRKPSRAMQSAKFVKLGDILNDPFVWLRTKQ